MRKEHRSFFMNPYDYNMPHTYTGMQPGFRQSQPIQPLSQPQVFTSFVKSAEQLNTINPMPNTLYVGINTDAQQIFVKRMNNDGITELKTYTLAGEQKKKSELQLILDELHGIKKHLKIGRQNESNGNS